MMMGTIVMMMGMMTMIMTIMIRALNSIKFYQIFQIKIILHLLLNMMMITEEVMTMTISNTKSPMMTIIFANVRILSLVRAQNVNISRCAHYQTAQNGICIITITNVTRKVV